MKPLSKLQSEAVKPIMDIIEIRKPSNWLLMSDVEREEWEESLKYKVSKAQQLMKDKMKELSIQSKGK